MFQTQNTRNRPFATQPLSLLSTNELWALKPNRLGANVLRFQVIRLNYFAVTLFKWLMDRAMAISN